MRVLGIITARGGSKGIPEKNTAVLAGKPLLQYTTEAALGSCLARVVLSTDSPRIAKAARPLSVDIPFLRPPELAMDDTPTLPVLQHVVRRLEAEQNDRYDAVFTLQPTNPLRLTSDIDGAVALLKETGAESVIGYTAIGERHPARMKSIDKDGRVHDPPFSETYEGMRRQDLPAYFLRDGSVYLTRRDVLIHDDTLSGRDCRAWLIPRERACNIDEPYDLQYAEFLLSLGPQNFPGNPAQLVN